MKQMNQLSVKDIAVKIRKSFHTKSLKDITLRNLISDCKFKNDDDIYLGLDWLASNNKIFFLVTPVETYVLPLGKSKM